MEYENITILAIIMSQSRTFSYLIPFYESLMDIKKWKEIVLGEVDRVHFEKMESCIRQIKKKKAGNPPGTDFSRLITPGDGIQIVTKP